MWDGGTSQHFVSVYVFGNTNVTCMYLDLGPFKPVVLKLPDAATSSSCRVDPPNYRIIFIATF